MFPSNPLLAKSSPLAGRSLFVPKQGLVGIVLAGLIVIPG